MAKAVFTEGTWYDGYKAFAKEFFARVDEMEIYTIIKERKYDKAGEVMSYLEGIKTDMLEEYDDGTV